MMWPRKSSDPLGKLLFNRYGLHVLSRPREDLAVFQVFPVVDGHVSAPGLLSSLIGWTMDLPSVKKGERLIDVSETKSEGVSGRSTFKFLEGFLSFIGAPALVKAFSTSFEKSNTRQLSLRFDGATRNYLEDPFDLELKLRRYNFDRAESAMKDGYRYYLVTAVHFSDRMSFTALDERSTKIDLSGEIMAVGGADAGINVNSDYEFTAQSQIPLAYGVELSELLYNQSRRRLELAITRGYVQVMGERSSEIPGSARSMIGAPDDSMLLEIDEDV